MGRAELSVNSSPLWVKSSGQACDSAILNQLSITREVLRPGRREFKLRPFSAGSILTLQDRAVGFHHLGGPLVTEPLISGLTPSLPLRLLTSLPDLTLGAIALRRFAPETPGRYRSRYRPHDDRNLKQSTPRKKNTAERPRVASTVRRLVSGFKFEVSRETNSIGQTSTVVFPSGWRYDHPTRDAHAGPSGYPVVLRPFSGL